MTVDESRKLVQVQAIIDVTHFRAAWRGQCYEATAVPDTSTLTVGDAVFCHVMPESTQLLALNPRPAEVLWFTPGAPATTTRGELWKSVDGTNAVYVLTCPNNDEQITCLWFAFGKLWMATWDIATTRVYTVDRSAATVTLRASWNGGAYAYGSPVVQEATFGSHMYLLCTGYASFAIGDPYPERYVRQMNPVSYAVPIVFTIDPLTTSYGGGLAVANDGGTLRLVVSDGTYTYYSSDGTTWVFDTDLWGGFATTESFGMLGDTRSGLAFLGDYGWPPMEKRVLRRNAIGNWTQENVGVSPSTMNGGVALTQQIVAGTSVAIWLQTFGWFDPAAVYWRDYNTGAWTFDWDGPDPASGEWLGSYAQGIVGWRSTVFGLWYRYWGGPESELYRRDAAGVWTPLTHASWAGYVAANTYSGSTLGMCLAR